MRPKTKKATIVLKSVVRIISRPLDCVSSFYNGWMTAAAVVFARGVYYFVSDEHRSVLQLQIESIQSVIVAIGMVVFAMALRPR
ncbi:MAG: hypothetical protein COT91_01440 [Candidatus Doudnabacteria bacterium CG10_big_fil_rev_8_21_14_0_10_41_10]|uniref:Uncharacterized protein n=1 Tax=Candidatus Doudnabacteria bacterium CG10_big_fil_rev_8_21_14_0_10_41_10 TaxID=1974551 RepID=A0A2H0VED9_9BACT|nr:MAG: hypothetical protein COT91_01440 [Candidatus Doudnabacteria bacterium CG10_big_fil_rev_8_21_14_0_10_41_10]